MALAFDALYTNAWNFNQLGEAIEATARRAQLVAQGQQAPRMPADLPAVQNARLDRWVVAAADSLGIEAEPVMAPFQDLVGLVQNGAPAILCLPPRAHGQEPRYLSLIGRGQEPLVLDATMQTHRVNAELLADCLSYASISFMLPQADMLLDAVQVPPARRDRARRLIIEHQLGNLPMPVGWLLRTLPSAGVWTQARITRLWKPLGELLVAQLGQLAVLLLVWWFIGQLTLSSSTNAAWMQAWALALLTGIPLQLWLSSAQSRFSTQLGTLFRQRVLFGTLQLHPDEIRHEGFGAFFERARSVEQIELLSISGGLGAALAILQLITAVSVLALGAGGVLQALLLVGFVGATLVLAWRYARTNLVWETIYSKLTNELVESMIGHRTRLAQQDPREWHVSEDDNLERYVSTTERLDTSATAMDALPRLWVVAAVAGLVPTFLNGTPTPTALAISLGGILLAFGALTAIAAGFKSLVGVGKAWNGVGPLFRAAAQYKPLSPVVLKQLATDVSQAKSDTEPVVRARNLGYRYSQEGNAVFANVDLEIYAGERVLLEGVSGGGKTTLAAVLAGLRQPETGMVFTRGLARADVSNQVSQRRIVMVPQFHENYIFSATMAFNLLMGRRWPPTDGDIAQAHALCAELGLGDLLARMPSGMSQMIGDNGWQLSHGERSRIYIARALLQRADMIILDESFAALDPENLRLAMETTLRRAPTLMVIAHP